MDVLLLIQVLATWYLVGLIWTIQGVHYPLFSHVERERFADFEARHTTRMGPLVMPAMLLELFTSVYLVLEPPAQVSTGMAVLGLVLVVGIWGVTFFLSVPQHRRLSRGYDRAAHHRLVWTNWLRTGAWTVRGVLVASFVM